MKKVVKKQKKVGKVLIPKYESPRSDILFLISLISKFFTRKIQFQFSSKKMEWFFALVRLSRVWGNKIRVWQCV